MRRPALRSRPPASETISKAPDPIADPLSPGPTPTFDRIAAHVKNDEPDSAVSEISALLDAAALECESDPPHRLYFKTKIVQNSYSANETLVSSTRGEADLIASLTRSGTHAPAIDIDLPCRLVPSGTPGHFHLYIDKEMDFVKYLALLKALVDAGIVEDGFYRMAKTKGASYLRVPNKPKGSPKAKPLKNDDRY